MMIITIANSMVKSKKFYDFCPKNMCGVPRFVLNTIHYNFLWFGPRYALVIEPHIQSSDILSK